VAAGRVTALPTITEPTLLSSVLIEGASRLKCLNSSMVALRQPQGGSAPPFGCDTKLCK